MNRSDFLKRSGAIGAGLAAVVIGGSTVGLTEAFAQGGNSGSKTAWPWPFPTGGLSASDARIRAHDAYWSGKGCSYAVFEAVVSCLRDTVGSPYTDLPTELMIYGAGGGAGWGATCGTINGGAAAISLVCTKAVSDPIVQELYGWYTQTSFPSTLANNLGTTNGYGNNTYNMSLAQAINGSPLCHISVSTWCKVSNLGVGSNDRKERCARMCGDVAAKVVELLNSQFATGTFTPVYVAPALNATCLSCHGSTGMQADVDSKMECSSCHGTDVYPHTTSIHENPDQINFEVKQNYPNPFSNNTTLEFNLNHSEIVSIEVYNLNGQKIKTLCTGVNYDPGKYSIEWDGRSQSGNDVDPGMYIIHFITNGGMKTINLMKL